MIFNSNNLRKPMYWNIQFCDLTPCSSAVWRCNLFYLATCVFAETAASGF